MQAQKTDSDRKEKKTGKHGYDNDVDEMRPLFLAAGPDFKKDYMFTDTFEMTNIYPLMCRLLRIQPSPCNGSYSEVSHLTREIPEVMSVKSAGNIIPSHSSSYGSGNIIITILTTGMQLVFSFLSTANHALHSAYANN